MDRSIYSNPLYATVLEGSVRVLKKLALEAQDQELAKLVSQIEGIYLKTKKENANAQ